MVLKSANYTNHFRISWKDIFRYQVKHETDIRNHNVMRSTKLKHSHGNIHKLCSVITGGNFTASKVVIIKMPSSQQKRRAKRQEEYLQNREIDELESSCVRYMLILNKSGRLGN